MTHRDPSIRRPPVGGDDPNARIDTIDLLAECTDYDRSAVGRLARQVATYGWPRLTLTADERIGCTFTIWGALDQPRPRIGAGDAGGSDG